MKFSELPTNVQEQVKEQIKNERKELSKNNKCGRSEVLLYNEEGTRYFYASVHEISFGASGYYWNVRYGKVEMKWGFNQDGTIWHELFRGVCFNKSQNGTSIVGFANTKKEALEIAHQIGIFNV